jgi:hypothetical protein
VASRVVEVRSEADACDSRPRVEEIRGAQLAMRALPCRESRDNARQVRRLTG